MSGNQDILVDVEKAEGAEGEKPEWVVRLERRDVECQFRFVDRHGNINSRLSSAQLYDKQTAREYAKAITDGHPRYKAKAMLYKTMRKRQEEKK